MTGARGRLLLVALLSVIPWTVVTAGDVTTLFFPFGFLGVGEPWRIVTIDEYLFMYTQGLPRYVYAWPLGVVLYGLALVSAALGWGGRPAYLAAPIATITTLTLVWWVYWPDLKGALFEVRA